MYYSTRKKKVHDNAALQSIKYSVSSSALRILFHYALMIAISSALLKERIHLVKAYTTKLTTLRSNAFHHKTSCRSSTLILQMARKRKNTRGSSVEKLMTKNIRKSNTNSNNNKNNAPDSAVNTPVATSSETGNEKKRHHTTPPWQVMSPKEVKSNAKNIQKRREAINAGILSPSAPLPESPQADTSRSNRLLTNEDRRLYNWKPFSVMKSLDDVVFNGPFNENSTFPMSGIPEVAFIGRSNVGKSSLLNALLSTSARMSSPSTSSSTTSSSSNNYARVGKTPGATASINYYTLISKNKRSKSKSLINFVDLPGFGYAKLSKTVQSSLGKAMQRYFNKRKVKYLALGILLLDARRTPTEFDKEILAALYDQGIPICMVATKIDKLKNDHEIQKQLENIEIELGVSQEDSRILPVSSVKKLNVKELWKVIMDACEMKVLDLRGEVYDDEDKDEDDEEGDENFEEEAEYDEDDDDDDDVYY